MVLAVLTHRTEIASELLDLCGELGYCFRLLAEVLYHKAELLFPAKPRMSNCVRNGVLEQDLQSYHRIPVWVGYVDYCHNETPWYKFIHWHSRLGREKVNLDKKKPERIRTHGRMMEWRWLWLTMRQSFEGV